MPKTRLDDVDYKILRHLQENARISNVELARKVKLSPSPCFRRVRDLEQGGIVRSYSTLLDPAKVGLGVSVFVQVGLDKQIEGQLEAFERAVLQRREVMECYLMTGDSDYLLRVVVPDVTAFRQFILDELTKIPGVASVKSSFALKQVKYGTALPLDGLVTEPT